MNTLKKNQHYVWRYYLEPWAENNFIWCLRASGLKPFRPNLRKIANERFFYRLQELSDDDLAYLEHLVSLASSETARSVNKAWIEDFSRPSAIRRALEKLPPSGMRDEIFKEVELAEKTLAENYHYATEQRGKPFLDLLRLGNCSFQHDASNMIDFIDFISHQYFRTAKIRNSMRELNEIAPQNVDRTWLIESFIFATNLGGSLYNQRDNYRIYFLENASTVPFIAGDQPVINLNTADAEEVRLFYPVTPRRAIIYGPRDQNLAEESRSISAIEVERLNHEIYSKSDSLIFAVSPHYLESLASIPKEL